MSVSIEELERAGFPRENWPEDLPLPGTENIFARDLEGNKALYRYQIEQGGQTYAMEVLLDLVTLPNPAEGVGFMLNQFGYLWRTDRTQLLIQPNGACRRINF